MTEEFQTDEFERFDRTVDALSGVLEVHRGEVAKASKVARIGVLVGIVGLIVGLVGGAVGLDGRSLAQNIQAARLEARASGCIQANVATEGARDALVSSILVFAKDPAHLTPREQAIADAYRAQVEKALPYRDCSSAGLDKYYEDPPSDPAKIHPSNVK